MDSRSGNDLNDGTSTSTPWRTIAKVNQTRLNPGDAILLSRGGVWREELLLSSSGKSGEPITIDAYGSGAPPILNEADPIPSANWSRCGGCALGIWQASVSSQPNVVIVASRKGNRKPDVGAVQNPDDWAWQSGVLYVDLGSNPPNSDPESAIEVGDRPCGIDLAGMSYVVVRNLEVTGANSLTFGEGAGIWAKPPRLAGPAPGHLLISHVVVIDGAGDGIHLENSDATTIEDSLVAFNDGSGIKIYGNNSKFLITSGAIQNNQVHHNHSNGINIFGCPPGTRCRSVVYPEGVVVSGLKITGNVVHDNGAGIYLHETNHSLVASNLSYSNKDTTAKGEGYCVGVSGSSSNIIEKNECYDARLSAIELSIDTGSPPLGSNDNVVRYNDIHDDGTNGLFTNDVPTHGNQFLYNIIYNHPNGSCIMANYLGHKIYNNTCYNNRIGINLYVSSSTRETGDIAVKNNIIANSSEYHVFIEPGVNGRLDFANNDYFPDGPRLFNWKGSISDFAGWRSQGQGNSSFIADPQFVETSPRKPSDFALRKNSSTVAKAEDLGKEFSLALAPSPLSWPDHVTLLPQSGSHWDVGAVVHRP
ncbi:MAG TPA: right-handed parallel beta-helix repeat-containing protein [Candidatus Acidoferrum sp.]|nr:right-handed parallel beta-helix repeat-containing protein [Candidatus Acidoferrum sp.]